MKLHKAPVKFLCSTICKHIHLHDGSRTQTSKAVLWQILETTAALMKAQSEEDAKGGNIASTSNSANEARRWTGVRTIVEARSLLKSLFRAAAGHKAQVQALILPIYKYIRRIYMLWENFAD